MSIDLHINRLLSCFNSDLWEGKTNSFYGRIFRHEKREGFFVKIQPIYYASTGRSIDVLKDSKKDAQCFFDVMPNVKMTSDVKEAEVRVLFMVNLVKLYPLLTRIESTEQVKKDVEDLILSSGFEFIQCVSDSTAFSDYQWSEDAISNLNENYLFRYDLKLIYTNH